MDKRTKILAGLFGAVMVVTLLVKVIYPRWVKPIFSIDARIVERQEKLDELHEGEREIDQAKSRYRALLDRVGSMDIGRVENSIRARIGTLITTHQLMDTKVTPGRPTQDRKTEVWHTTVTVAANGELSAVVRFLRDLAELPQLVRFGNVVLSPASSSRRSKKTERRVNVRVPIEVRVLPQQQSFGKRFVDRDLKQPETNVRHGQRDYSMIWKRKPFMEFVPLAPLVVNAGADVVAEVSKPVVLRASPKGGDGKYTYEWTPPDGLTCTTCQSPKVDTSELGRLVYTVVVRDGSDNSKSDSVKVTIREPAKVAEATTTQPPPATKPAAPPAPKRERWTNGRHLRVNMATVQSADNVVVGELALFDNKTRKTSFYTTGDEFDGGQLVYVYPRGGLVRWEDQFYVYPLGAQVDAFIDVLRADEHPVLQNVVERILGREKGESAVDGQEDEAEGGSNVAKEADGKPSAGAKRPDSDTSLPTAKPGPSGAVQGSVRQPEVGQRVGRHGGDRSNQADKDQGGAAEKEPDRGASSPRQNASGGGRRNGPNAKSGTPPRRVKRKPGRTRSQSERRKAWFEKNRARKKDQKKKSDGS